MAIIGNYFERSVTADKRVDSSAFTAFRTKRLRLCQLRFQFFIQSKTNKDKLKKIGSFIRFKENELTNIILERLFSLINKKGV